MNNMTENIFNIKDLYVVKLKEGIKNDQQNGYVEVFNVDLFFIAERILIKKNEGVPYFFEVYTECITEKDLYAREGEKEWSEIPPLFESIQEFPVDYLNEEEKMTGKIRVGRIFQIFQEINIKSKRLIKKR